VGVRRTLSTHDLHFREPVRAVRISVTVNRTDLFMALRVTTADENGEDAPAEHRSP
jgi:hypothetical protein